MNNKKFFARLGMVVLAIPFVIISCQKTEEKSPVLESKDQSLVEKMQYYQSLGVVHQKSANAELVYAATLCNDSDITADAPQYGIGNSDVWTYYQFYGVAGQEIDINLVRITCEMDPAYTLYFGTSATTEGLDPFSSTNPDLTYVTFRDDNLPRPESCEPDACFAFYDPSTDVTLPSTGWYTLAVYDFASCGGVNPLTYHLTVSGLTGCTIVIDGCDTDVDNQQVDGVFMQALIDACAEGAKNHGQFVSCVAQLTNEWLAAGLITDAEKDAIVSCAAQSGIPY